MLRRLGVLTPATCVLELTDDAAVSDLHFTLTHKQIPVVSGLHFGSLCPVDPDREAIFDFLPVKLTPNMVNPGDFVAALVLDTFLGQTDTRQVIFTRDRKSRKGFAAHFIDWGQAFGGSAWQIWDPRRSSTHWDRSIYQSLDVESLCARAVEVLLSITREEIENVAKEIPDVWFTEKDREEFGHLLSSLMRRRQRLAILVEHQITAIGLKTF